MQCVLLQVSDGECYFPSTRTENKVEITLFSVPVPNPNPMLNRPVLNVKGER